jgi:hypothetical protein
MTTEELTAKYKKFAEPGGPLHGLFAVRDVITCNYRVDGLVGHPFTIGTEHVVYASDHNNGILDDSVIEKFPCAAEFRTRFSKCGRPAAAHTYDTVLLVYPVRDLGNKEAADALFRIKPDMLVDKIPSRPARPGGRA